MNANNIFIKGINWIITGLLTLLGFSGCDNVTPSPQPMYGTPSTDYMVKGKVMDKATQKPIKGIRVGAAALMYMCMVLFQLFTKKNLSF